MADETTREVHADVLAQLETLQFAPDRPLLVSDADEVLFHFMTGFENWLLGNGFSFDWTGHGLANNVKDSRGAPVPQEKLHPMLLDFFAHSTELLDPVEHAAGVLERLQGRAQILVLSNLPLAQAEARARALARHGMPYPLVANIGSKGATLRHLSQTVEAPVLFIDDLHRNHTSVRRELPRAVNIHFVANRRLAALMGKAPDCDYWADSWIEVEDFADAALTKAGY